jgi:SpoVK/Ycf46/Vps4 family AAA+-type ATPase
LSLRYQAGGGTCAQFLKVGHLGVDWCWMDDSLLASLRAAVDATPDDVPLRVHYAELLATGGDRPEAVRHAGAVLQRDPDNVRALALITGDVTSTGSAERPLASDSQAAVLRDLDAQLDGVLPPRFMSDDGGSTSAFEVQTAGLRLADVAGMAEVKARLEASVLTPMRNPELMRLYRKSLSGGLLLYGPPGCGKTFIARALAGEMAAGFLPVSLADVLDMFIGQSEQNIRGLFETARCSAPCVIFLDEVDAIGQKRTQLRNSATRGTVNQLLSEMDGIAADNEGVFVLGATNHPWDVDVALRRPGRFDRMLLVAPPDEAARREVFRYHLHDRPIENVDVDRLARKTDGYSGADLAYICELAAESALVDSARSGVARMIGMHDLDAAAKQVRPSIGSWLEIARNVAQFSNQSGSYDQLVDYLKTRRML